ncbi:thioredoxin [Chloroflexus sp.]
METRLGADRAFSITQSIILLTTGPASGIVYPRGVYCYRSHCGESAAAHESLRRIEPMAKPIVVNDSDFAEKVLQSSTPVVVDFWAPWCGPCRVIAPILDKLANEYEGRLTIAKVNTDDNVRYASQLGIQGIPTLVIFKNGKEVGRLIGARPEAMYREIFDKVLAMA